MNFKIVSDSSANLNSLADIPFSSVPLHVVVGDQVFADVPGVDLEAMQKALHAYKGKTSTACPSPQDWVNAFGDAENVFCVTITSQLSGAYASAVAAKNLYMEEHPGRNVYVIDSLSTGPEMVLLIEKLRELLLSGMDCQEAYNAVRDYASKTRLFFTLTSLENFAKNGRINPLIAKGIGVLGVQIIGTASEGTLKPLSKRRGSKKAYLCMIDHMLEAGYKGGKIVISHTGNPAGAQEFKELFVSQFGEFNGFIHENQALCSYYAEPGSILVGVETEG